MGNQEAQAPIGGALLLHTGSLFAGRQGNTNWSDFPKEVRDLDFMAIS